MPFYTLYSVNEVKEKFDETIKLKNHDAAIVATVTVEVLNARNEKNFNIGHFHTLSGTSRALVCALFRVEEMHDYDAEIGAHLISEAQDHLRYVASDQPQFSLAVSDAVCRPLNTYQNATLCPGKEISSEELTARLKAEISTLSEGGRWIAEAYLSWYRRGFTSDLFSFHALSLKQKELFFIMLNHRNQEMWDDEKLSAFAYWIDVYMPGLN